MNQVRLEAMRGDLTRMRDILFAQLPIDHPDLRGFEWYYWYRYLTQAKKLHHFDDLRASPGPARPLVLPKAQIVVLPVNKASKLVDINSGEVLQELTGTANQSIPWAQFAANGRAVYAETVQAQSAATLGTNPRNRTKGQPKERDLLSPIHTLMQNIGLIPKVRSLAHQALPSVRMDGSSQRLVKS